NVQIEIEDAGASPIRDAVHVAQRSLRGIREKQLSVVGHCFKRAAALKALFCCQRVAEGIVHLSEHGGVVEENSVTRLDDVSLVFRKVHQRIARVVASGRASTTTNAQVASGTHRQDAADLPPAGNLTECTSN